MATSKKLFINVKWLKKESQDLSAVWYEASVPQLDWIYIVETGVRDPKKYTCYILFDNLPSFQEIRLTNKEYTTRKQAMVCCEKHLHKTLLKIKKLYL